jgi:PKHD-type hydroxylase
MEIFDLDIKSGLYGVLWQDILSNEEIVKIHNLAAKFKETTGEQGKIAGSGVANEYSSSVRRSDVIWIGNNPESAWLYKKITDAVRQLNDEIYQFDLAGAQPFQYTVYRDIEKGEYDWHNDTSMHDDINVRKISVCILLSDTSEFKGGSFLYAPSGKPIEIEQEKGRMLVFPSWIPHCVTPVLKGTRISLVMWLYGPRFR